VDRDVAEGARVDRPYRRVVRQRLETVPADVADPFDQPEPSAIGVFEDADLASPDTA
jgi:hypothetical protein